MPSTMHARDGTDEATIRAGATDHRLAIDMARQALTRAEHLNLERLARDIIADQSAEVRRMQTYLAAPSG
jgi:uncharacterized protein (DUF305 family)